MAFAAKNIQFNPAGVVGGPQAQLGLVTEHWIDLGPNIQLHLRPQDDNYIEWNCSGFEMVHLEGEFVFSGNKLLHVSDVNSATIDTTQPVKASFQIHVNDLSNMLVGVTMTPFTVKGANDFVFTVNNAFMDWNDQANPPGMVYPPNYPGDPGVTWNGFYLQNVTVRLPNSMNKNNGTTPTTIGAQHLIIDNAGISGKFFATNVINTSEGDMSGWGYSIDQLSVQLNANHLTGGSINGDIAVPAFNGNTLEYGAVISEHPTGGTNYLFTASASDTMEMDMFKAKLTIDPASQITVDVVNNQFKPQMVLSGLVDFNQDKAKVKGIQFQSLSIITDAPYVTSGSFAVVSSDSSRLINFPLSINNIALGTHNGKTALGMQVAFNIGDTGVSGFSATTQIKLLSNLDASPANTSPNFSFDKITVDQINIIATTTAFHLEGFVMFNQSHPTYGDGFYGSLNLKIPSAFGQKEMLLQAAFGSKEDYRYWMVDAAIPVYIPIQPLKITQIRGGISKHMRPTLTPPQLIAAVNSGAPLSGQAQMMVPDDSYGLGFKAGVAFETEGKPEGLNGDVVFNIMFNGNGGLQYINLIGDAYAMTSRADRSTSTKYFRGTVAINYDNSTSIFTANMNAQAYFGAITGQVHTDIEIGPSNWHVKIGTPLNPGYVNLKNLAYIHAYFMMGQNLPGMIPPPACILAKFPSYDASRNITALDGGNGVAFGAGIDFSYDNSIKIIEDKLYVILAAYASAGFDITAFKLAPGAHCSGSSEPVGMNSWYMNGQLYVVVGGNVVIQWRLSSSGTYKYFELFQVNLAVLLQGKFPKPTYVQGIVDGYVSLAGLISTNFNVSFAFGNDCTIVQN